MQAMQQIHQRSGHLVYHLLSQGKLKNGVTSVDKSLLVTPLIYTTFHIDSLLKFTVLRCLRVYCCIICRPILLHTQANNVPTSSRPYKYSSSIPLCFLSRSFCASKISLLLHSNTTPELTALLLKRIVYFSTSIRASIVHLFFTMNVQSRDCFNRQPSDCLLVIFSITPFRLYSVANSLCRGCLRLSASAILHSASTSD